MNKISELRLNMVEFIRNKIIIGEDFTMKEICDGCNISYENRFNTQKVYAIIYNWRKSAKIVFNDPEIVAIMEKQKTIENEWDMFLYELNQRDVFLLFSSRRTGKDLMYYQPGWLDKEILDFVRMENKMKGQITVLLEMDMYGESLPKGMLKSPKELASDLISTLDDARTQIAIKIENEINELEPPGEKMKELITPEVAPQHL